MLSSMNTPSDTSGSMYYQGKLLVHRKHEVRSFSSSAMSYTSLPMYLTISGFFCKCTCLPLLGKIMVCLNTVNPFYLASIIFSIFTAQVY